MPESTAAPFPMEQGTGVGDILLLLLYLLLILVGVYFATRFFARAAQRGTVFRPGSGAQFRPGKHIKLVDRLMLDREKSIVLFEADGKRYLIGVSNQAFALLDEGEAPPQDESGQEASPPFRDMFTAWMKKQGDAKHAPEEEAQQ